MKLYIIKTLLICVLSTFLFSCSKVGNHYMIGHLFVPTKTALEPITNVTKVIETPLKITTGNSSPNSTFKAGSGKELIPVGMNETEYYRLYNLARGVLPRKAQKKYNSYQSKLAESRKNSPSDQTSIEYYKSLLSGYETYYTEPSQTKYRNELARRLILISDSMAHEHMANTMGVSTSVNLATGVLTNLASEASILFTPRSTKNILSGVAATSNSYRSLWNEEVYKNAFVDAIVKNMRTSRQTAWNKISGKFAKNASLYPVDEMLLEINQYHYSGSFAEALSATVTRASREKSVLEIDATIKLLKAKKQEDSLDKELIEQLDKRIELLNQQVVDQILNS